MDVMDEYSDLLSSYKAKIESLKATLNDKENDVLSALSRGKADNEAILSAMRRMSYASEVHTLSARAIYADMLSRLYCETKAAFFPVTAIDISGAYSKTLNNGIIKIYLPECPNYTSTQDRISSTWFEKYLTDVCKTNRDNRRIRDCIVDICDIYPEGESSYRDADNIDTRTIMNVLKRHYIADDNLSQISLFIHAELGEIRHTEIHIVPRNLLAR